MASFVRYDNEVEVTSVPLGLPVNTWTSIDLSSFLDDTDAIGVLLRVRHDGGGVLPTIGCREVGYSGDDSLTLAPIWSEFYGDFAVGFGGSGNSIEWRDSIEVPFYKLFVVGEIHGPHVKLHDQAIDVTPEAGGTWTDTTPTLIGGDSLGDIAAVIHRVNFATTGSGSTFGLREKGSTDPVRDANGAQAFDWFVTGLDANGYYQTYTGHKLGFPQNYFGEAGYILKTGGVVTITNPSSEGLAEQSPGFGVVDLSGTVSAEAFIAGGLWVQTSETTRIDAFLRATGATETGYMGRPQESLGGQSVGLDNDLAAEYSLEANFSAVVADLLIQWYEERIARLEGGATLAAAASVSHSAIAALSSAVAALSAPAALSAAAGLILKSAVVVLLDGVSGSAQATVAHSALAEVAHSSEINAEAGVSEAIAEGVAEISGYSAEAVTAAQGAIAEATVIAAGVEMAATSSA